VFAARARFRETEWTLQIASRGDFDQRDACVLFMFRAKSTIVGAAFIGFDAIFLRDPGRLVVVMFVVVVDIGADEIFHHAMFGALFAKIDAPIPGYDLRVDQSAAMGTEAAGGSQENIISRLHGGLSGKGDIRFLPLDVSYERIGRVRIDLLVMMSKY